MINQIEAFQRKVCCYCEVNVDGELTRLQTFVYQKTALCPECYDDSIISDKRKSTKAPVQMGLPLVGEMPAIISMSPLTFGTMVIHDSKLLTDCMVRVVDRGSICTFDIICSTLEVRNGIGKYLNGN